MTRITENYQLQKTANSTVARASKLVHVNSVDSADSEQGVVAELSWSKRVAGWIPKTSAGDERALVSTLTNVNKANESVARDQQLLNTTTNYLEPHMRNTDNTFSIKLKIIQTELS